MRGLIVLSFRAAFALFSLEGDMIIRFMSGLECMEYRYERVHSCCSLFTSGHVDKGHVQINDPDAKMSLLFHTLFEKHRCKLSGSI